MQAPISRPGPLDVQQKPSPATPRTARKLKTLGSNSVMSPNPIIRTPKDRSPKVVDRKSPRIPAAEKKRPNRLSELEPQIGQLQEELKKAKDQLSSSETCKRRAQQEAEEAKKQLAAMSVRLEETHKQLRELSESEEDRVQELRKISQDRDRAWQSELEAVQKQYSMDSAALASAMNEIQKLKIHLERVSQSEASQARHAESAHAEIQSLRIELTETLVLVEKLKEQLNESREYEAQALEEVSRARMLLEAVKKDEKRIQSDYANNMESYNSLLAELEQSKNRVKSLEELVSSLQTDRTKTSSDNRDCDEESENLKAEVQSLKSEVEQLRSALEDAEKRYRDEYIQSTLQIRNAYDHVEHTKSVSCQKEAELDVKIKESRAEVEKLRAKLMEKEDALQIFSSENGELSYEKQQDETETGYELELKKSESELEDLRASLSDREALLMSITEENKKLKREIMKKETERSKANDEALELTESLKAAEQEALTKLGSLTEEADKSCKKVARVTEQLDATQASNTELETELRRLKVQCDQWRKAAEAAAAMLSNGNNGKHIDKSGSLDFHTVGKKMSSSLHSEDTDDDSPKKRNGNMLKKIGVLLKKGQK